MAEVLEVEAALSRGFTSAQNSELSRSPHRRSAQHRAATWFTTGFTTGFTIGTGSCREVNPVPRSSTDAFSDDFDQL